MATTPEDVLRVNDNATNLTANLKNRMFGFDNVGDRFAAKVGGVMKWVSTDEKQVLLAGVQTITGIKTHNANLLVQDGSRLGVGATTPAALLDINGVSSVSNCRIGSTTANLDSELRLLENRGALSHQGSFLKYDGGQNKLFIGMNNTGTSSATDITSLTITRATGEVEVNERFMIKKEYVRDPLIISSIADQTVLDPTDENYIHISDRWSTPGTLSVGLEAGTFYGQSIFIAGSDETSVYVDDAVGGSSAIIINSPIITGFGRGVNLVWMKGTDIADFWGQMEK